MSFKEDIKELLTFTKGERKGIVVLLIILFIVAFAKIFSGYFKSNKEYDYSEFEREVSEFEKYLSSSEDLVYDSKFESSVLFRFDPNITSEEEFTKLGLNKKQIQTIKNYLSAGGRFVYRSDFKKIYTISEEQYKILEDYIDLPLKNKNTDIIYKGVNSEKSKVKLFNFNPNSATDEEWILLGFSIKQVSVIRRYIDKGGKFFKKEDLNKIYVISDKKYKELEPYIQIENTNSNKDKIKTTFQGRINISKFTKDDFIKLGGIWEKLSSRLVKFRDLLGGYSKKEQLKEVYGFKEEYYHSFSEYVDVDLSLIKKINVNFTEVYELSKHPYLSKEQAEKIINFRNSNGSYKYLEQLRENNILSAETFIKIKPYLKVK